MAKTLQNEREAIKEKLQKELALITFSSSEEVLKRTQPKTFSQKIKEWWNKEISVSLVPVGIATLLLISLSITPSLFNENKQEQQPQQRQIIQVGGNFYWNDLYEEVRKK